MASSAAFPASGIAALSDNPTEPSMFVLWQLSRQGVAYPYMFPLKVCEPDLGLKVAAQIQTKAVSKTNVVHSSVERVKRCSEKIAKPTSFVDSTYFQVCSALDTLERVIISERNCSLQELVMHLTLRGNQGGPVVPALDIAALFLPKAASSSEILIEALSDNNRAVSLGARTVGKNITQAVMTLSDGSGLCFSVLEFRSPTGRWMGEGHLPRMYVPAHKDLQIRRIKFDAHS